MFLLATAMVSLTFASVASAQGKGPTKLAFVDLQRALNEVEDGKKAKSRLKKMFQDRQKKLDTKQENLKLLKEKLEEEIKGDLLSDAKKKEKMMEYQRQFYELQVLYSKLQKELTASEAKETKKIFKRFQEILRDLGLQRGYTMIFEKTESSVLWAPNDLDITDQLIQRYNSK
jgi:outer membrane protein